VGVAVPDPSIACFTYRAFISYSHRDKAWADWLHKALETYRVPSRLVGTKTAHGEIPRRLNPIFRDREELSSSPELGTKINEALAQSENLIVLCSRGSATSRWVNEEVLAYKRMGRAGRIFCLIVDGEPNATDLPGREAEECFCPALRFATDAGGRPTNERIEPIAADVRPGKDGKANAKLKLIAGMLDVGFDALKQREQRRQVQRMTAIAGLALVVMAVTIVLAIAALVSRHRAVVAQHEAVVAQQAAQRRQKQAEGLVNFMLGDLNDKLNQVHRLDIMQAVDDKAMAYFQSLPTADATDAALAMRVTALEKIGDVRAENGNTTRGLRAHEVASTLASELLRRDPNSVTRQVSYADSLLWIGGDDWYLGNLERAGQMFETASNLLTKAAATQPVNTDLSDKLAAALVDAGRVLEARGDYAAAKPYYNAVLKVYASLSKRDPRKAFWQTDLGDAYGDLGKVALEQGHLGVAITEYEINQRIEAELAKQEPGDHNQAWELVLINGILGRTLMLAGETTEAERHLRGAVDGADALTHFDATVPDWYYLHARYSEQLGGVLRQMRQLDKAAAVDANSLRELHTLVAKDPHNTEWQQELAASDLENARLALDQNHADTASQLIASALDLIAQLRDESPKNQSLLLLAAQARIVAGRASAEHGDVTSAQNDWQQAFQTLTPIAQSSNDIHVLATWAAVLLELDDLEAAKPVVAKLEAAGYNTPDFTGLAAAKDFSFAPKRIAMDASHP
jgi:tetratricopeptide (TPR) repeat protein